MLSKFSVKRPFTVLVAVVICYCVRGDIFYEDDTGPFP